MKKSLQSTTLALLITPIAPLASAEYGYYIAGTYGINNLEDSTNKGTFTSDFTTGAVTGVNPPLNVSAGSPVGWKTSFDEGASWSFIFGWKMDQVRIELEYAFTDNDIDDHTGVSAAGIDLSSIDAGVLISGNTGDLGVSVADLVANGKGELETETFFVNAYYDFSLGNAFIPFLGLGLGMSQIDVNFEPSGVEVIDDEDDVFVYQLMAGIGYDLSKQINIYASAIYRDGEEAEVDSSLLPAEFDIENESFVYNLGVRYAF